MKTTVNLYDFREAFRAYGREVNFSYEGLDRLYDYLEELEADMGSEIELDVIALCCDFSEDHYSDIAQNYNIDLSEADGDESEEIELVIQHLQDEGAFIATTQDNQILYRPY